ncbi:hypothetical protein [Nonomuraea sp. 10N515B]|uniref:hypothetical protein n=1 Tax=Nonomuraea sp. 10N515B TaxID=3457422 RepID=UPI003FCD11C3
MKDRTPDGRTLVVDGNSLPFLNSWAYVFWMHGPDGAFRAQVVPAGSAEILGKQLGDWPRYKVREIAHNGGRILSLEDASIGGTTFVWVGPQHEIATYIGGTNVPLEIFMDWLAQFDVQDSPTGLTMLPRPGSRVRYGRMLAFNTIDQVCSVQIKPKGDVTDALPRSTGKRVRGGSMWRSDEYDEQGNLKVRSAIVVNDTTATTIVAAEPDDPAFVGVVESVSCGLS